ncbi:hypothetical protein ACWD4F_34985 [Streptomyces aureus]|uniref:hypothetical protein n=1 Tax=Streptomyces aureus TaxID=193461 RepID=UPI00069113BF|nr:hypothetical protein [Streptomyces aureus]
MSPEPQPSEQEPSEREHTVWDRVRRAATGMNHHQAKEALGEARKAAEDAPDDGDTAADARTEAEEWERITDALADHAGAYDPATDPFVQGQLAARSNRGRAAVVGSARTSVRHD